MILEVKIPFFCYFLCCPTRKGFELWSQISFLVYPFPLRNSPDSSSFQICCPDDPQSSHLCIFYRLSRLRTICCHCSCFDFSSNRAALLPPDGCPYKMRAVPVLCESVSPPAILWLSLLPPVHLTPSVLLVSRLGCVQINHGRPPTSSVDTEKRSGA